VREETGRGERERESRLARAGGARGPAEGAGEGGERHVFVVVKSAAAPCAWEGAGTQGIRGRRDALLRDISLRLAS
jgi:hypothetical protein